MDIIQFTNLKKVLADFTTDYAAYYKELLVNKKINASMQLSNSVEVVDIWESDNTGFKVIFKGESYWKDIEEGRKPGATMPILPSQAQIIKWIRVKPIIPYPNKITGKLPTNKQLANLIINKISTKGIKAKPIYKQTFDTMINIYHDLIEEAIRKDVKTDIKIIFNEVNLGMNINIIKNK